MIVEIILIFAVVLIFCGFVEPWEVNPISGEDEYETLGTFFANIDLSFAERLASG